MSSRSFPVRKFNGILFVILEITQLFSLIALTYRYDVGIRITYYIFGGIGILLLCTTFLQKRKYSRIDAIFALLVIYIILLWIFFSSNFDTVIACTNFLLMVSVWYVDIDIKKHLKSLSFFTFAQGAVLLITFFSNRAYAAFTKYTTYSDLLTLGIYNPNETGMIVLYIILLLILLYKYIHSKLLKSLYVIMTTFLLVLLYLTKARASILAICFLFLGACTESKFRSVKNRNILSVITICIPTVFPFVYMLLFEKSIFSSSIILGKKLFSGRQRVYLATLDNWNNILFGNLNFFRFSNTHNAMLSIMVNIGIVGLFLFFVYTLSNLFYINKKIPKGKPVPMAYMIILCLFIVSIGESAILNGGNVFYCFFLMIIQLSNFEIGICRIEHND